MISVPRLALVCVLFAFPLEVAAQNVGATLQGLVTDEQQGILPGVTVTITNLETGVTRTTVSDATAWYRAPALAPGTYEVRAELAGFVRFLRTGLALTIGQEPRIDIVLKLATLEETVTVTGGAPLVNVSSNTLGTTVTRTDLETLPLVDRNFISLANLTPGVTGVGGGNVNTAGQLSRNNSYMIDGVSNDDTLISNTRGGFSIEAVREYVVLVNQFTAEYGVSSGAIVSVVTRSGTNKQEQRAFVLHRDAALDAQNPFAKAQGSGKAPFSQQRYGGVIGGPIVRDKLFYFASYEGLRVRETSVITSSLVPVAEREWPTTTDQHQGFGKVDLQIGGGQSMTFRHRVDDIGQNGTGIGGLNTRDRGSDSRRNNQDVVVTHTAVLSPRRLNEFRFQFGRLNRMNNTDAYSPVGTPQINRPSGNFGKSATNPQGATEKRYQFVDNYSYNLGKHDLKAGTDISIIRGYSFFPRNLEGTFTFATDRPFDAADLATYPTQFTQENRAADVWLPNELVSFFMQDTWRATSTLTLNLGIRYDFERAFRKITDVPDDMNNVRPRLGFAWSPFGDARTAVRGGYGVYVNRSFTNIQLNVVALKDGTETVIRNPGYPDPFTRGTITTTPSLTAVTPNPQSPETQTASLGFEREIRPRLSASADVVYSRGYNLFSFTDINYPLFPGGPRPDPTRGRLHEYGMEGKSWSTALLAGVKYRPARGPIFGVAYTLSKALRDVEDFQTFPQDQLNRAADKGPADNDRRHQLVANFTWMLPAGIQVAGLASARSGLPWTVTTGIDNNVDTQINDRPDLAVPGGDPLDRATYFANFTNRVGNLGRNTNRGPRYFALDLRLSKLFVIQRMRAEVFAEAFNLTNYNNLGLPVGNLRSASFGQPTALATSAAPRRIELGARVDF
jgi:hypothetical protein